MRVLLMLLLLANVLVFTGVNWWWERPSREMYWLPDPADIRPGLNNLTLISEWQYGEDSWTGETGVGLYHFHDEQPGRARFCQLLGPLVDAVAADTLLDELRADGINARRDDLIATSVAGYSVILGPYPDSDEARDMHRQLNEAGLENFVFSDAERRNGISLGFFGTSQAAENLVASMEPLGFAPVVQERKQLNREHWVTVAETGDLPDDKWQEIQERYPVVSLRRGYCTAYEGVDPTP